MSALSNPSPNTGGESVAQGQPVDRPATARAADAPKGRKEADPIAWAAGQLEKSIAWGPWF